MAAINTMVQLIQSLTKSEKRTFALFASSEKNKAFMQMYKILSNPAFSPEQLEAACKKKFPGAEFHSNLQYLYTVIMRSLMMQHQSGSADEKMMSGMREVKLLFRKGLPAEGFEKLGKLRQFAVRLEKYEYALILDKMYLHYLSRYQFQGITEEELLREQALLRKHIQYELNLADHASLYELLNFRFLKSGLVRSAREKEKLNDLIFSEMNLAGNPRFQSFDLKKNHLLFQSVYFMMTGDYKSSLSTFYELNQLFEDNRHLWTEAPLYYVHHLRGILNNLQLTGQYDAMEFFISRLMELKTGPADLPGHTLYLARMKMLLGKKDYKAAFNLMETEKDMLAKLPQLHFPGKAEVLLYTALACFCGKEFRRAARYLLPAVHLENLADKHTSRILKLLNLMVHFELHDFHYISNSIRSLETDIRKNRSGFSAGIILLGMFKKYPATLTRGARRKLIADTLEALRTIETDPYEGKLFHVFNFSDWLEEKLASER